MRQAAALLGEVELSALTVTRVGRRRGRRRAVWLALLAARVVRVPRLARRRGRGRRWGVGFALLAGRVPGVALLAGLSGWRRRWWWGVLLATQLLAVIRPTTLASRGRRVRLVRNAAALVLVPGPAGTVVRAIATGWRGRRRWRATVGSAAICILIVEIVGIRALVIGGKNERNGEGQKEKAREESHG